MTTQRAPLTQRIRRLPARLAALSLAVAIAVVGPAGAALASGDLTVTGASPSEQSRIELHWEQLLAAFPAQDECIIDLTVNVVDRAEDFATSNHGSIRAFYRSPGIIYVEHTAVLNGRTVLHEMAHHVDTRCRFRYEEAADRFREAQGLPLDTSWFSGSSWYTVPAEQFAEAVLVTMFGVSPRMTITSTARSIVSAWATEGIVDVPAPAPEPEPVAEPAPEEPKPTLVTTSEPVVLVDNAGRWYLYGASDAAPKPFYYGNPGDLPFVGDWDCDGESTPGLYRQSDGFVYIRNTNTQGIADIEFYFGNPGDVPIVGDFDGDGCDSVSIWRPAEARVYIINRLGEDGGGLGAADYFYTFGNPGDVPFVGDFDGDGIDTVGLYRPSTGYAFFRNTAKSGAADASFYFGNPGDRIVAGDWDGDGDDTVGLYRPTNGDIYLNLENRSGAADITMNTLTLNLQAAS